MENKVGVTITEEQLNEAVNSKEKFEELFGAAIKEYLAAKSKETK